MKKLLVIATVFLGAAGFAAAQAPSTDILGAHLNAGRGCSGCHAPHSGAFGAGKKPSKDLANTGTVALGGEDVSPLLGATLNFGGGAYPESFPATMAGGSANPDVMDVLLCLSCHDGNTAKGAMMTGHVYEHLPSSYGTNPVPTFLGNDCSAVANYSNDHPVGPSAKFSCGAPYNWDCTAITETKSPYGYSVTVTPGPNMAKFINNYGFFVSLVSTSSTSAYVTCTSCHNQHVMNVVNITKLSTPAASGTAVGSGVSGMATGPYATMFFLRGPYNPNNSSSNSATQFCRQCHGGEANESNGVYNVPTTD